MGFFNELFSTNTKKPRKNESSDCSSDYDTDHHDNSNTDDSSPNEGAGGDCD
ncbi:MAG: hypothetical protein H6Q68_1029 [Firmicutes bacterium]|nr:hypothetical protein [Bacillota bacterium]